MSLKVAAVIASISLASVVSLAEAAPYLNVTFDGDILGSAPSVQPPVAVSKPSAIGGYTTTTSDNPPTAANGTIVVSNDGGMSKGVTMTTNPANAVLGALWLDNNGFNVIADRQVISFDLNIIAAPTIATTQVKNLGAGTAGIVLGMNAFTNTGSPSVMFAAAATSENGGVFSIRNSSNTALQSFFNYVEGQTYNITLDANFTTGIVSTAVDGIGTGDLSFWTTGASNVGLSELFFFLNGQAGLANSVALDNITATAVPEPATFGLLGLAGLAMLKRRRQNI